MKTLYDMSAVKTINGFPPHSQVKVFLPDRVEVAVNGLGPLLCLPNLNRYIRVTGACFVFSLKALGTCH